MTPDTDPDWTARCRLALSILNQRDPDEQAAELAVMALRGWPITEIIRYTTEGAPKQ